MDKPHLLYSKERYQKSTNEKNTSKTIYWGIVKSIDDDSDGGRIKVNITEFDYATLVDNLPWCYPVIPKFLHMYPKIGEIVRVHIEDPKFPQRSRFYTGSVISQLQNIKDDSFLTALSTTNVGIIQPQKAMNEYPDAKGVFPEKSDIALIGRDNSDVILREKEVELRAGKHEYDDVYVLNKNNPASIRMVFEQTGTTTISSTMIMSDKIALISHKGIPNYKASEYDQEDRNNVFNTGHPLGRGDVIAEAFELLRKAILQHIHPYSGIPADKSGVLIDLEKVDFNQILQKNIVIN